MKRLFAGGWRTAAVAVAVGVLLTGSLGAQTAGAQELAIFGWVEPVMILPTGMVLPAKLDSGARHSSLHATGVERYEIAGQPWVRFELSNEAGDKAVVNEKLHRIARIKRFGGQVLERPVILLRLCIGTVAKTVEVNLQDRTGFNYPMLIGRSFLASAALIDSEQMFRTRPECPTG